VTVGISRTGGASVEALPGSEKYGKQE